MSSSPAPVGFGPLLRRWRETRRMSQLTLAAEANVSARHLSFVETGRAQPSRELILRLARRLEVPPRDRNALLLAAGFAPIFRETPLESESMSQIRHALQLILRAHEPYGAMVLDGRWDVVMVNAAQGRMMSLLSGLPFEPYVVLPAPRLNAVRMVFDPQGLRPLIENWEAVARVMLARDRREAAGLPAREEIIDQVLAFPGVAELAQEPDNDGSTDLVLPVVLRIGEQRVRFFSTITTLGTARDITLQELSIESFHPADAETERFAHQLAAS